MPEEGGGGDGSCACGQRHRNSTSRTTISFLSNIKTSSCQLTKEPNSHLKNACSVFFLHIMTNNETNMTYEHLQLTATYNHCVIHNLKFVSIKFIFTLWFDHSFHFSYTCKISQDNTITSDSVTSMVLAVTRTAIRTLLLNDSQRNQNYHSADCYLICKN